VVATVTLDADELVARARDATGLDDLGDDTLATRLASFTGQLAERLDDAGRTRAAAVVHDMLVDRLRFFDARRHRPIAEERIERPIIVFGEARSGTTLLQMLLGCDPGSRLLEFWEVMRLSPPPGLSDDAELTERRRAADADWREILDQIPRWLVSHPYNAMLGRNPPECERLWAFDFRALPPSAWWRVPTTSFPPLRLERDDARQYEIHRMVLQHLQYAVAPSRWVLKGTTHQYRLAALLDAYPDAVFVWIHRDPLVCIASRVELQCQVYEGVAGHLDRGAFAAASVERSLGDFAAMAADPLAADPRIHHLVYQDFTADPVAAIGAVYERGGLATSPALEAEVRRWLAENPPNRFGRFEYSVDALGVDVAALDRQLDPYRDRFGVPREHPREG
jgi:hypothetical protein